MASSSAGMRDMPTSAPAPAMAAPNKPLVDELMEARRERYKRARLQDGSALCQVFPLLPSRNAAAVEPVAADRQASTAPAQHGLLEAVQAGEEESNEKVEGRSTAHLLLRVLALSYVVPLCDLSDIGVPGTCSVGEDDAVATDPPTQSLSLVRAILRKTLSTSCTVSSRNSTQSSSMSSSHDLSHTS